MLEIERTWVHEHDKNQQKKMEIWMKKNKGTKSESGKKE